MTLPVSGPLSLNDIQTEFGGTNPIGMNEYYAGGGLVPAGTSGTYGAVPSSGTISIQNFYGTSNFVPIYIEEVFNTWVYTGAGGFVTITNGINVSGNGGLVWVKNRNLNDPPEKHIWADTARGGGWTLSSNSTAAQSGPGLNDVTGFTSSGFTIGNNWAVNKNSATYVSWTFRKQPKFFDIVTYTGDGTNGRAISHSLGSIPGFVIVKRTDATGNWKTYHYLTGAVMSLNTTGPSSGAGNGYCGAVSSTTFSVFESTDTASITDVNASGGTYIAYLFAHNAGGFGATGTDNVITCGYYEGNGLNAGPTVNLGYEPQWLLYKRASVGGDASWGVIDNMRGWATSPFYTAGDQVLRPNTSNPEFADDLFSITPTGFQVVGADPTNNYNGVIYIYIAIRRGPMKTPTTGTSVFNPLLNTNSGTVTVTSGILTDAHLDMDRPSGGYGWFWTRLLGTAYLDTKSTSAQSTSSASKWDYMDGYRTGSGSSDWVSYALRRAPGFFDVVCYTGVGGGPQTLTHNLGVAPELVFVKSRNQSYDGFVYSVTLGLNNAMFLFSPYGADPSTSLGGVWGTSNPTSTTFTVGNYSNLNNAGDTYVAYLFASCPGVSKVGSYTGTGSTLQINCGFTGGARFVLIKRTDASGGWYVWDSARGIVAGNDPYLTVNSVTAEVTNTDWVDTHSPGFELSNAGGNLVNVNGGTYIFLAIA